jgi:FkbM family methyltransferase
MLRRLLADSAQRNAAEMARLVGARQRENAELTQTIAAGHLRLADAAQASATNAASLLISTLSPRLDRLEQYGYASARRSVLHCAQGEVMVKTEAGYVMCSDSDLALLACLADSGDLERGTRLLIERLLRPGDVFVDVGANVGMHTLAAARTLCGQGRIIAFEPFEATRQLLEKTMWINGFDALTEIHGSAVSDREGVQTLFLGTSSGHHSLFELGDDASTSAQVPVHTVRLESVIAAGMPVNLLKIDAEGAELDVLRGALGVVRANPDIALIVEFGPAHLRRTGQTSAAWLAAFTDLGFDYRAIDAVSGALNQVTLAQLETSESTNLLFARPQSAPWVRLGEAA